MRYEVLHAIRKGRRPVRGNTHLSELALGVHILKQNMFPCPKFYR